MHDANDTHDTVAPTLRRLGIHEHRADRAHAALVGAGWPEIGYGYHGSVHAHPDHPGVVVRLAVVADGFADYVALLRRGFAGSDGPHAPEVHDMLVGPCGALLTVSSRLSDPPADAWWLAYAHAVLADDRAHPDHDGVRDRFRAAWPGYEPFCDALRAAAPRPLDGNEGNVLVSADGTPVVNDPLCDESHRLWADMPGIAVVTHEAA